MPVLPLTSIRDTALWQRLDQDFQGPERDTAQLLAQNLVGICREAYDRMKAFPSLHAEYTLHDATHLLRVTELMARVMPADVAACLNPVEISLLVLAAHFHDQGMVLDAPMLDACRHDPAFMLFQDNWSISHPNLRVLQERLRNTNLSADERQRCRTAENQLDAALLTDFVRETHCERSARFVTDRYGTDPRWEVAAVNIADLVARLCRSHGRPATDLTVANGFRHDEVVGTHRLNLVYLGLVLRLADVLDFDRDRTPDSLYRTISFHSPISLREWEKHRSVAGWVIQPDRVQFTLQCEHPEYQRAAYQFMDAIDRELMQSQAVCRSFPASASAYRLDLPLAVDRSRIEPKDGSYIYSDLEFSLSRDEIVKLLMTEELYGSPSFCVRELLQNALDALRHRRAVFGREAHLDWPLGRVDMSHGVDSDGYEVVRCSDNGIGMDRLTVERFLTKVGRSYYRSPEFEQERQGFRAAGVDFDPCAQFGVGFMSCFMLGDRITVTTRKDLGPSRGLSEPLVIEINGLSGIVVLRSGPSHLTAGTTVEITSRQKPSFLDPDSDRVKLIEVVEGFALATEFPISAVCTVPELAATIEVPPTLAVPATPLEAHSLRSILTFEIPFSRFNPLLKGMARTSILVDEHGTPSLKTFEAAWVYHDSGYYLRPSKTTSHAFRPGHDSIVSGTTCLDGIAVSGSLGRRSDWRSIFPDTSRYQDQLFSGQLTRFILDVRGSLKPPLTAARTAPRDLRQQPGWARLQAYTNEADGLLFEHIAESVSGLDPRLFWTLLTIHRNRQTNIAGWIPSGTIWSKVLIPCLKGRGHVDWLTFPEIGVLGPLGWEWRSPELRRTNDSFIGREPFTKVLGPYVWQSEDVVTLVIAMSTVILAPDGPRLEVRAPRDAEIPPFGFVRKSDHFTSKYFLPFADNAKPFLQIELPFPTFNRDHALSRTVLECTWNHTKSALEYFATSLIEFTSDMKLDDHDHPKFNRSKRRLGHLHRAVDWRNVSAEYQPPYAILSASQCTLTWSHETFETWANLPSISDANL